jgi:hypothetical protein
VDISAFKILDFFKADPFKKAAGFSVFDQPPDKGYEGKNDEFCYAADEFCDE